jgi:hypothetical protein
MAGVASMFLDQAKTEFKVGTVEDGQRTGLCHRLLGRGIQCEQQATTNNRHSAHRCRR